MFIAVMDCEMRIMNCGDKVFGVKDEFTMAADIFWLDWVHVVNQNSTKYLPTGNTEVATVVSCDDQIPNPLPLRGAIKELVHIPIKTEGLLTDNSV